ncbi:MAG: aminoacyl-histidine dipeptidase [Rikenellaceae bacterium]
MDTNISALAPSLIWKHFAAICSIPHPSHHEAALREYIVDFAKQNNIECIVDEGGNIVLRKAATPGMENLQGVIMQGHIDMVPQKNGDKEFDFTTDPIEAYIDGEWVTANGTTLGADNGIGVAAALAVMESSDLKHGPIEALFTYAEETGMDGAFALKPGILEGDILLNMDSETEGELYVGCAGGVNANMTISYTEQALDKSSELKAYEIEIAGLSGGHSGMDIILGRGNANKILVRILKAITVEYGVMLASIDGGGLRNAIPREARAIVVVDAAKEDQMMDLVNNIAATVIEELDGVDDAIEITTTEQTELPETVIDNCTQKRLLNAVYGCPNGVIRMSPSIEGLTQTSTNLARVVSENGQIKLLALLRSSSSSEKDDLAESIRSVFELAKAEVVFEGEYDGWIPNLKSPILSTMQSVYKQKYGSEPAIMAIHAGLECGIFSGAYPNLDMISFGPTIRHPHSPDEKVHIASVDKFWDFLCSTLENIPTK